MLKIWKYLLGHDLGKVTVSMPAPAKILSIGVQSGEIVVWAIVGPGNAQEDRVFAVCWTGNIAPSEPHDHLGTVQIGALVYHIFHLL